MLRILYNLFACRQTRIRTHTTQAFWWLCLPTTREAERVRAAGTHATSTEADCTSARIHWKFRPQEAETQGVLSD